MDVCSFYTPDTQLKAVVFSQRSLGWAVHAQMRKTSRYHASSETNSQIVGRTQWFALMLKTLHGRGEGVFNLSKTNLLARVSSSGSFFSQMSVIYFCLGFSCCPYYWGDRKARDDCIKQYSAAQLAKRVCLFNKFRKR